MKQIKMSVIREMKINELEDKLSELSGKLIKMKLNHAVSPLDNPVQMREIRKNIARIHSELGNREFQNVAKSEMNHNESNKQ